MKGTSPPPFSCQRPRPCGYGAKRLDARGPCRPWPAGGGTASLHRRPALRRQALRRSRSCAPKPSPPPCRAEGRPARVARGAPAAMSAKRLQQQVEALSRSARHCECRGVCCPSAAPPALSPVSFWSPEGRLVTLRAPIP